MQSVLSHFEATDGLRPRHPAVCILDLVGCITTLGLLAVYPQKFVVASLPISIVMLYVVSFVYHWLPANLGRQKADHLMIAVVIAMTYIPFWGNLLPTHEAVSRFVILGALFAGVCTSKLFLIEWHKLGGVLFFALGLYGTATSFYELQVWLPSPAFEYFWGGIVLYTVQLVIYSAQKPNPLPERFGYREVQHVVLVTASTLQSFAVLKYL